MSFLRTLAAALLLALATGCAKGPPPDFYLLEIGLFVKVDDPCGGS